MTKKNSKSGPDVRLNQAGKLDEIVAHKAFVHLEQMSDKHWWLSIEKNGKRVVVNLSSESIIFGELEKG